MKETDCEEDRSNITFRFIHINFKEGTMEQPFSRIRALKFMKNIQSINRLYYDAISSKIGTVALGVTHVDQSQPN